MIQASNKASVEKRPKDGGSTAAVIKKRLEGVRTRIETLQLIWRIALIAVVLWYLFTHVFLITQAKGQNMFPAVKDGDLVIAFRMQKEYMKGDVVVIDVNGEMYVGRIGANATDIINLNDSGTITVNGTVQGGEIIYPTYAKEGLEYPLRVPENNVFILGDYRIAAEDSRDFGPVPFERVLGKVITILRRREL